jgi:thiamine pyrophosphate-dependent acetolactate synthase large subunit-like protein
MLMKSKGSVNRRGFLKGAAASAAALVATAEKAQAQQNATARPAAVVPNSAQLAADTGTPRVEVDRIVEHPGSDFMMDVIKSLNFEYITTNPGSSFQGLHESIINYGGNTKPELLTCCHEESAVAMAHGYAKIEGKPIMALLHGTVGTQHASMAIYNAYADRVPIFLVIGNHMDAAVRPPGVNWYHSAQDMALMIRDYTKWDDNPASLGAMAASSIRAYRMMMTPPMGPVAIVIDSEMQENAMPAGPRPRIPKLTMPSPPQGDMAAVREAAKMLVAAQAPRINCQRAARTPEGMRLVTELADLLQCPVNGNGERMHIPSRHPLAGTGYQGYPVDLILDLEVQGGAAPPANAKSISISSLDLFIKSNIQDFQPMSQADLAIAGDAQATLPSLIEEVKRQITGDRKRVFEERGMRIAEGHAKARQQAVEDARYGWDSSPISLARLAAELWPLIKNEDWSLVGWQGFIGGWPGRLWNMDKHYHYIGGQGGGGIGYNAPAAVGAALANRKYGRLSINIQTDGDLNFAPGVLWTAAHHKIPLLTIMHNNRGYHAEVMFVQRMAAERNRGVDRAHIGTRLIEPNINYAKMAETYGLTGIGPISDPKDMAAAFKRGIEIVKKGEPVVIDTITQPR